LRRQGVSATAKEEAGRDHSGSIPHPGILYELCGLANDATGGANGNISGRTLGGGLGFGMLGSAVSQSSKYVGMAFGYYGLAWSVYSNVIARGGEVKFDKNAMMDIKFGARTPPKTSKFRGTLAGAGL
jgi:hypothetical protein